MSEQSKELYRVVFRGELAFGRSEAEVKAQLRERFKFGDATLDKLFSGKAIVLKNDLDEATAQRYAKAFWEAGARCSVEPLAAAPQLELARREAHPAKAPTMVCPKCEQSQPEGETCVGCGVVVAKFRQRQEESFLYGAAPAAERAAPPAAGGGGALPAGVSSALAATRPWVRMVSILLFVGAGLGLLAAVIAMAAAGQFDGGPPAMAVGLIQALSCALYLVPAYFLYRYAGAIGDFLRSGAAAELEAALLCQKSFWKFVGILTLVMTVVALLGIAAAILIPTLMSGR